MLRIPIIAALLLLCPFSVAASRSQDRQSQPRIDQQIILDLTSSTLASLLDAPGNTVYVIEVIPSRTSGEIVMKNEYTNYTYPDTKLTVPIVQRATYVGWEVSGHFNLVDVHRQQKHQVSSPYHWIAPYQPYSNTPINIYNYMPWTDHDNHFVLGGIVMCLINTSVSGSSKFSHDVLIPSAWQQYVSSALRYHKEHPSFFSPDNAKKNNADLVKLANSSNPFLSIEATRSLAKDGLLGASFIQSDLAKADFYKQAVDTLLVLRNATPQTRPGTIKDLSDLISTSANADAIKGIALAAFVTNNDILLAQLDKKETALNSNTPADKYIVNILQTAGTRKSATEIRQP